MRKLLALIVLVAVSSGCGGSSPLACRFDILFQGDSIELGMHEVIDANPFTPYGSDYIHGLGTPHILGNLLADVSDYDIVVLNAGAWDISDDKTPQTPHSEFELNLATIHRSLQR